MIESVPMDRQRGKLEWKSLLLGAGAAFFLVAAGFLGGYLSREWLGSRLSSYPLVHEAHQLLESHFLGEVPEVSELQRGMIRGMIAELEDPFTNYVEPAPHNLQTDDLAGRYGGIGALISQSDDGSVVLVPFEGGPAALAGIQEGELLLAIDGRDIAEFGSMDEISSALRGVIGTDVRLTVGLAQSDASIREITIERAEIQIPSVTSYVLPSDSTIGVLVIARFSERTPDEVRDAFQDLVAREVGSLILDLRGNAGGLLAPSIEVARFFLHGDLVLVEERGRESEQLYRSQEDGPAADFPLAILVDHATASAAEVVSAALQANDRAPLIGTPTFGKGSVQAILELSDGSSLHVTVARWVTPLKVLLDGQGLTPDIPVTPDGSSGGDPWLQAAEAWLADQRELGRDG